ncbi:TPA: 2-oxoacid:acceptor oxidoreductase subunit alpha [bacterium]|nr:2-oxoacid:acceptor oxidoreductase subunit alpha [bacterium]HOK29128.1 2-oxoacid:acceptor oxidoreductase subunit alpha [bacterium]HOL54387.1 2-oxoacid:acceptor oxidoreductase subunit alpha [bacterium]HPC76804.1 2-oxoacid:acceptor oxidoreductase subunit alpha [bacterium]HPO81535.1 2-oxoacid:acceptor oxidoreductase subunit alpha [bacterium]
MDIKIVIGGEAGQGIQTISNIMSKFFLRSGYYVFTEQSYQSRIRGGHNFTQVRVSSEPVSSPDDGIDILVALNRETVDIHSSETGGIIIYDNELIKDLSGDKLFGVPLQKIAIEKTQNKLAVNSVACGVLAGLLDGDISILERLMREQFKDPDIGEKNVLAVRSGYEIGKSNRTLPFKITPLSQKGRLLIDGGSAVGFGAIVAGCRFLSAYPMTPGTAVMNFLAGHSKRFNIVVEQAEDEIAAINMVLGASFAGVRSMVTTSGGGFALMVEGLSLAGMTETPCVIHIGQRPGPATGLPTRTEQGELLFVINAGHGEFPRYITAPRDAEDAFYKTIKAFNLADKYQIPSIILTDQFLIDSMTTIDSLDVKDIKIERHIVTEPDNNYARHLLTSSGISPRALPGTEGILVITDSDEHDEEGHITEDLEIRKNMVEKRLKRGEYLKEDVEEPVFFGDKDSSIVLTGWGSTYGILKEAVNRLTKEGISVSLLHFSDVYPLPDKTLNSLRDKRFISVENNATGQLAQLIRRETGINITEKILKYNGRPFTPSEIVRRFKEIC